VVRVLCTEARAEPAWLWWLQLKKSSVSVLDRLETRAEVGTSDKKKRGESIPTYDVSLYHMG